MFFFRKESSCSWMDGLRNGEGVLGAKGCVGTQGLGVSNQGKVER